MRILKTLILFLFLITAACGGTATPQDVPEVDISGQVLLEISGAVTQPPIRFTGGYTPTASNGGYLISGTSELDDGRDLFLYLAIPNGPGAGSYGIKSWAEAVSADGTVYTAVGGKLVVTGNDHVVKYEQVSTGTLVLTTVTPFSGTFEFTSAPADGGDAVTVKGSFELLQLPPTSGG